MQLVFACRISIKFGRSHDRNGIQLVVTGLTDKGFQFHIIQLPVQSISTE